VQMKFVGLFVRLAARCSDLMCPENGTSRGDCDIYVTPRSKYISYERTNRYFLCVSGVQRFSLNYCGSGT